MKHTFSIVINTYNRAHTLGRTLQSLLNLRHSAYEVIVVNGPSDDGTDDVLARYTDVIRIGHCAETNLSKSRNIGIAMAAGEIVCFLDDDAVPEPCWLNELELGYSDDKIAAVGGYIRDHTGYTFQSKALTCDRFGVGSDNDSPESAKVSGGKMPDSYFSLTGTNCSFRRKVLIAIGGFDEEFAYFLDETDVIVRLVDAGHLVKYVPTAEIHHKYAESHLRTSDRIPKSIYLPARSKAYFCVKNAAPKHSMNAVFKHLEVYRRDLRNAYDWYLHNNKIDAEHHRRLHDDIDRGITHGISDAFLSRKLLTPDLVLQLGGPFKPVTPIRAPSHRLKICFLSQEYPTTTSSNPGGISIWTRELAEGLAAMGHEVTVIARGQDHTTVDFEEGVWIHRVVPVWQPDRKLPALPDIPPVIRDYAYSVYDEVMRIQVLRGLDCISSPIWDLEGIACIADGSIPTVLSLHSTYKLVLPSKPVWVADQKFFREHVQKMIMGETWALENASLVLANTQAIVKDIESSYAIQLDRGQLCVCHHGISPDQDYLPHEQMRSNTSPGDELRLLYVGRFEKRKGIDTLLDALPDLLTSHANLVVDLVGDSTVDFDGSGPIFAAFTSRHANEKWFDRVKAHGAVSNGELRAFYRQADIFVAPSRYESFGLIFLEAMRVGKPCIGTAVGGIPEVVADGRTGFLIPAENPEALADAVTKLVTDSARRIEMGQAGYKVYQTQFTLDHMVKSCEQAFEAVCRRQGNIAELARPAVSASGA